MRAVSIRADAAVVTGDRQRPRTLLLRLALLAPGLLRLAPVLAMAMVAATEHHASAHQVKDNGDPQVRVCPDGGYESGCDREDIAHAVLADAIAGAPPLPEDLGVTCLFRTKARCTPTAYGLIPASRQAATILWQHMDIQPSDGPRIDMLVLIERPEDGPPVVLAARQTEGWLGVPQVIIDSANILLIHASGRNGGTGAGNADIVLTRHEYGATHFDVGDLLGEASQMLPGGFSLASGAQFNFREMHGYVPVRRDGDAGCCATGGMAHIDLSLPRGNWMQVDAVTFEETTPVRTHHSESLSAQPDSAG